MVSSFLVRHRVSFYIRIDDVCFDWFEVCDGVRQSRATAVLPGSSRLDYVSRSRISSLSIDTGCLCFTVLDHDDDFSLLTELLRDLLSGEKSRVKRSPCWACK